MIPTHNSTSSSSGVEQTGDRCGPERSASSTTSPAIVVAVAPRPPEPEMDGPPAASSCTSRIRKRVAFVDDEEEEDKRDCSSTLTAHWRHHTAKRNRGDFELQPTVNGRTMTAEMAPPSPPNDRLAPCDVMPLQSINNLERCRLRPVTSPVTCAEVSTSSDDRMSTLHLPTDPRVWSRIDVYNWLQLMHESCAVDVDADRFRMNGKALCLMTRDMFTYRVPHGGLALYKDFQTRLCRAVAISLHRSCTAADGSDIYGDR